MCLPIYIKLMFRETFASSVSLLLLSLYLEIKGDSSQDSKPLIINSSKQTDSAKF